MVSELGLQNKADEPFFRDPTGNIVLFRGEHEWCLRLPVSTHEAAMYGDGAYLANVPSAVAHFVYGQSAFGVAAYRMPEIKDNEIRITNVRYGTDRGEEKLVLFRQPFASRCGRIAMYGGLRPDRELPRYWALLRKDTASEVILQAERVAWLGTACLGKARP